MTRSYISPLAKWVERRWAVLPGVFGIACVLILVLWSASRLFGGLVWLLSVTILAAVTWRFTRPEMRMLFGSSDLPRPWLARLREHRWRPLAMPFVRPIPRGWAYAVLAIAWWWLLR